MSWRRQGSFAEVRGESAACLHADPPSPTGQRPHHSAPISSSSRSLEPTVGDARLKSPHHSSGAPMMIPGRVCCSSQHQVLRQDRDPGEQVINTHRLLPAFMPSFLCKVVRWEPRRADSAKACTLRSFQERPGGTSCSSKVDTGNSELFCSRKRLAIVKQLYSNKDVLKKRRKCLGASRLQNWHREMA